MPLSVPMARSTPQDCAAAIGGSLPKYLFDVGQTTTGTSASAHLARSSASAMHMWTTNAGSMESTRSMSSRTRSLTCIANTFRLSLTMSATSSM